MTRSNKHHPTRRAFLSGEAIAGQLADVADNGLARPEWLDTRSEQLRKQASHLATFSRNAMGCEFSLLLNGGQYPQAGQATVEMFELVEQLEQQMSVFRADSEVSQINRRASQQSVPVESALFDLLLLAQQSCDDTGGAFDITSGPLSEVWGFNQRQGRIPAASELDVARQRVGSQYLRLDKLQSTVWFTRSGVSINLGAIGKGYALDRCARLLRQRGIDNFLLHGGQSSVVARGSRAREGRAGEPESGWTVGISHPLIPAQRIAELALRDQALATSGSGRQGFYWQGRRLGHVLDPRTGWPSDRWLSTTVLCETAAEADALATAVFVMSWSEIQSFCAIRPRIGVVLIGSGERAGKIELRSLNLCDGQLRRCS